MMVDLLARFDVGDSIVDCGPECESRHGWIRKMALV